MSTKTLVFIGMGVGSLIGGYVPILFGIDMFSYTSLFTSSIGAILGIFIGYKLST